MDAHLREISWFTTSRLMIDNGVVCVAKKGIINPDENDVQVNSGR